MRARERNRLCERVRLTTVSTGIYGSVRGPLAQARDQKAAATTTLLLFFLGRCGGIWIERIIGTVGKDVTLGEK